MSISIAYKGVLPKMQLCTSGYIERHVTMGIIAHRGHATMGIITHRGYATMGIMKHRDYATMCIIT